MVRLIFGWVVAGALLAPMVARAELAAVAPKNGETVATHAPEVAAFLDLDFKGRCAQWKIDGGKVLEKPAELAKAEYECLKPGKKAFDPQPVCLTWQDGTAPFAVTVRRDGGDGRTFASVTNLVKRHCEIYNLEIGGAWVWSVRDAEGKTAESRFRTSDRAPRVIRAGRVPNMRDLGGWRGLGGRRVRQGLVYRCAAFNGLAKKGVAGGSRIGAEARAVLLDDLGIRTDLDLRKPNQICYDVSPLAAFGDAVVFTNVVHGGYGLPLPDARTPVVPTRAAFEVLARPGPAKAVHCIYGRDRTGGVCGLLLALLGVSEDDIYRDYQFSNTSTRSRLHGFAKMVEDLKRDYPAETLAESAARYFEKTGVTRAQIEAFREAMLEKGETR